MGNPNRHGAPNRSLAAGTHSRSASAGGRYRVPFGVEAMNAEDSKPYKERLVALRARLRGDVSQMADAVLERTLAQANGDLSSMPIHMADIGTDNFEREFTLTLMESKDRTLEQIEEALERMEDGIYGVSKNCSARIPKARLNAIPYAVLCVRCAACIESE